MASDKWAWPVSLATYDNYPKLRRAEQEALVQCVERLDRFQTPLVGDLQIILERLTRPLWETLKFSGIRPALAKHTVNFLLRQMHQRQTPYWIWCASEWGEVCTLSVQKNGSKTSLLCIAYLLGSLRSFYDCGKVHHAIIAKRIFGQAIVATTVDRVEQTLSQWGYTNQERHRIESAMTGLMLLNAHPAPEAMTYDLIATFRDICPAILKRYVVRVSNVLAEWGILDMPLPPLKKDPGVNTTTIVGIAPQWVSWCQRWLRTSALRPTVKKGYYYTLLQTGRWLTDRYPQVTCPEQWTREIALEFVIHIREQHIGDYATHTAHLAKSMGKPLKPASQLNIVGVMRTFFRDCLEWEWIKLPFDPMRYLKIPFQVANGKAPNPRIIADDIWAKLLWAGLNLHPDDLPTHQLGNGHQYGQPQYPFEMTRAIALLWLFSGLRSNEIRRLWVGCIRWDNTTLSDTAQTKRVCLLDVPVNKTSSAFTKPVSYLVGEAIEQWQAVRPIQPLQVDDKTREQVTFLFAFRGKQIGRDYLNRYLIPLLCRKANLPQQDIRGRITSHRARSTIASQLANAHDPMTLLELMQWLGHSSTKATQHYVKLSPSKLTQAYSQAGYFDRNLRTIEVLVDQDVIRSGNTQQGDTWKYYDLGHGYCSYDFFDQCPHRMACAKCTFYVPKSSSAAQILEAKANLQRMLQQIPLTETEIAAVEDGVQALATLQEQLQDIPTPSGKTPRELQGGFVLIDDIS